MKNQSFSIYHGGGVYFGGSIRDGKLEMVSEVYGDDYDSERHYTFSKEATDKLFRSISLEGFIRLCKKGSLDGMEEYLKEHGIEYSYITI